VQSNNSKKGSFSEVSARAVPVGKVYTGVEGALSQPSYFALVMECVTAVLVVALMRQNPPKSGSKRQQPEPAGVSVLVSQKILRTKPS